MRFLRRPAWLLVLACLPHLVFAAPDAWQGKSVSEFLDSLNDQGEKIIFSSDVVTDDMLIQSEPMLSDPQKGVRALLGEHGLLMERGPADTWLVRRKSPPVASETVAVLPLEPALPEVHLGWVKLPALELLQVVAEPNCLGECSHE